MSAGERKFAGDGVADKDDIDLDGLTPDEVQDGGGRTQEERAKLKAVMHQHMAMLTSAGVTPAEALAIAAHVAALVYSKNLDDALAKAFGRSRLARHLGRREILFGGGTNGASSNGPYSTGHLVVADHRRHDRQRLDLDLDRPARRIEDLLRFVAMLFDNHFPHKIAPSRLSVECRGRRSADGTPARRRWPSATPLRRHGP